MAQSQDLRSAQRTQAVAQAEDVAKGGTPDALLRTMMSMLANRGGVLLPAEEDQFVPLIVAMAARAEQIVRENLARRVAELPAAPRGLCEYLAHDTIDVSRGFLVECEALDDDLLVDIVENETPEHAGAVAMRQNVSATVSAAIIGGGTDDTILLLLNNPGAEIAPLSFAGLIDTTQDKPELQGAMVARDDLPVVLAQRIFWMAGVALRQKIMDRFPICPEELDDLLTAAVDQGIADPVALEVREGLRHLVGSATGGMRISVSDMISAIKADRIDEFIGGVSARLGIRPSSVKKILADQGGEALAVLCRALYADRTQFTSVLLKHDYQRFGTPRPSGQIEQVAKIYDGVGPEHALATVQIWDALEAA